MSKQQVAAQFAMMIMIVIAPNLTPTTRIVLATVCAIISIGVLIA